MTSGLKKILKYFFGFALAAVLVYFAVRNVDWEAFLDGLASTRWGWVVLSLAAAVLAVVFRTARWQELIRPFDPEIRFPRVLDAENLGNLANVALPGTGELLRTGIVSSKGMGYDKAFGTIALERVWDILAVALLFVLALILNWSRVGAFFVDKLLRPAANGTNLWLAVALLAAVIIGTAFLVYCHRHRGKGAVLERIAGFIDGFLEGLHAFGRMDRKFLFLAYTAGIWVMYLLMSYFVLKAIPTTDGLGLLDALFLSAVGNFASIVPVPGGMGAYHYVLALTLSSIYGSSWETGLLFATICHESHSVLLLLLGGISYISISIRRRNEAKHTKGI